MRLLPTGAPWAGAGEPDFDTPGHIIEAAIEAMRRDHLLNPVSVAAKSATSRPPSRRSQKKSAALAPIPIPIPVRRH